MRNAGWLFYRNYYHWLEKPGGARALLLFADTGKLAREKENLFQDESRALTDFGFEPGMADYFPAGNQHIELETTYPGLLVGSGYSHQTGTQGEFKLGFFFDHCTGLPLIPGSSVKGLLRSVFPNREERATARNTKEKFVKSLLNAIRPELGQLEPAKLEDLLFDGLTESGDYLPMSARDIFLDACITGSRNNGRRIFDEDYLTPHPDPLKNPVPVRFLKILPGVQFRFHFMLKTHTLQGVSIGASDKAQLFRTLLKQLGAGAKTNVGYGQFTDIK